MKHKAYFWILFIIWPFSAFLLALRKGFNKHYQSIILAFAFLYGYSIYLYSGDILDYERSYHMVLQYNWNDFWYILTNRLNSEALSIYAANSVNRKPDVFAFTLQFLISRISDNPRFFWSILSVIYTKFMLIFFNEVYQHIQLGAKRFWHYIIIVFLIVVIPFYVGVTGVRFWPAVYLFMYFFMRYVDTRRFEYLLGTCLTILIHYSFFVPVAILWTVHFLPVKRVTSKLLVLVSLIFFALSSTTSIFNFLSKAAEATDESTVGQSIAGYTNEDLFQSRQQKKTNRNWYVSLRADSIFYILMLALLLELLGLVKLKESVFTQRMYPYLIIFFSLTLITYYLGSIGRFKNIFYLLALARYSIIFPYNYQKLFMKGLTGILAPTLVLYIVVSFRAGFYTVDPYLLINNSIGMFFMHANESLSEFLVGH